MSEFTSPDFLLLDDTSFSGEEQLVRQTTRDWVSNEFLPDSHRILLGRDLRTQIVNQVEFFVVVTNLRRHTGDGTVIPVRRFEQLDDQFPGGFESCAVEVGGDAQFPAGFRAQLDRPPIPPIIASRRHARRYW